MAKKNDEKKVSRTLEVDGRGYLQWVVNNIKDNEYLTTACRKALGA